MVVLIDPFGSLYVFWLILISLCASYNLWAIPLRMGFEQIRGPVWMFLDYSSDLIYWMDMGVNFFLSVPRLGIAEQDLKYSRQAYVRTTAFLLDCGSVLPTDIIYAIYASEGLLVSCRLNRFLKAHRILECFERLISHSTIPTVFRFVRILMYILVLIHWTACAYYAINVWIGFGFDAWTIPDYGNSTEGHFINLYIKCFHWATVVLSDEGDNSRSYSLVSQVTFRTFFTLIGHVLVGTTIAFVANIFATVNVKEAHFRKQLDGIKRYMEFRHVDPLMQQRILSWASYMREGKKFLDNERDLDMLPKPLRRTIAKAAHFDTFQRVKLFDDCEPQFLEELIMRLEMQVFSPGDLICRKGDVGREMYVVRVGTLRVVGDDGTIFATLAQGSVFGEISLLSVFTQQKNRRTANVMSASYSELFSLSSTDFREVLESFPLARAKMIAKSRELLKDQTLSEVTNKYGDDEDEVSARIGRLQDLSLEIMLLIESSTKNVIADTARLKKRLDSLEKVEGVCRRSTRRRTDRAAQITTI